MEKEKFVEILKKYQDRYAVENKIVSEMPGIIVKDTQFDTLTFFSDKAISGNSIEGLLKQTHHGKNIEQITRVTGFFSKVSGWNKGKKAELKDRYRSGLGS